MQPILRPARPQHKSRENGFICLNITLTIMITSWRIWIKLLLLWISYGRIQHGNLSSTWLVSLPHVTAMFITWPVPTPTSDLLIFWLLLCRFLFKCSIHATVSILSRTMSLPGLHGNALRSPRALQTAIFVSYYATIISTLPQCYYSSFTRNNPPKSLSTRNTTPKQCSRTLSVLTNFSTPYDANKKSPAPFQCQKHSNSLWSPMYFPSY